MATDQAAAPILALRTRPPQFAALTQATDELFADFAARQHVDRLVNRLVRDLSRGLIDRGEHALKIARNLLRRPAFANLREHMFAQRRALAQLHRPTAPTPAGALARREGVVTTQSAQIARQLPGDRRGWTAQFSADPAAAAALVQMPVDEIPLGRVDVLVSLSHGNTRYPAGCCTSNLRTPPS